MQGALLPSEPAALVLVFPLASVVEGDAYQDGHEGARYQENGPARKKVHLLISALLRLSTN